jgi:glycerol kinase
MKYVLALDQGTTSSRAIVFDQSGSIRGTAQKEFRQIFPQPGWVEHHPEDIWKSQLACAREALRRAKVSARQIAGLGISNQRETTLVWDRKTGRPVHNAIVWQDRRTADACERLKKAGLTGLVRRRTGLVIDPYFSATKIAWILDHKPGLRRRAERGELCFGTVDTWLVWKLTGGRLHVTDVTNASRTMLYDIHKSCWDETLLKAFRIPWAMLPVVGPSSHVYGETDARLLGTPVPIAGIAGDQQAALFGQGCVKPGMAKNTYGTGCFMLLNTGTKAIVSKNGLLTTRCAQIEGEKPTYALEGSVFVGGAVVQWLRDGLGIIKKSEDVEKLAGSVKDTGGVYFVPAFTGLGAPYWDPYARGTVLGLTRGSSAGHIARAALESIAFQSAELLHAMREDSGINLKELRVDGGASANALLMQFQANVLQIPVIRPQVTETTALGGAALAAKSTGVRNPLRKFDTKPKAKRTFRPAIARGSANVLIEEWQRATSRSQHWKARD